MINIYKTQNNAIKILKSISGFKIPINTDSSKAINKQFNTLLYKKKCFMKNDEYVRNFEHE